MLKSVQNFLLFAYFFSINFQEYKLFNLGFLSIPKVIAIFYLLFLLPSIHIFLNTRRINFVLVPISIFFIHLTLINILNINDKSYEFLDFTLFINIILFWFITIHFSGNISISSYAVLSFALGSVLLSFFYLLEIGVVIDEHGRISIFDDNSNFVGIKMAVSIILIIFLVIQNTLQFNLLRYCLFLPIPLMLKLLIDTGSRVSLISLVLMMLVGFLLVKKNGTVIKITIFLIFTGSVLFFYNFILENPILLLRLSSSIETNDLAGREVIYAEIWDVVSNNLFLGIGQTGYFAKFGNGSPHNVLLEIICYSGILGLSFYFFFLYKTFIVAIKSKSSQNNILPFILLIPLCGLILSGQILDLKLGWVIFSYVASSKFFLNKDLKFTE